MTDPLRAMIEFRKVQYRLADSRVLLEKLDLEVRQGETMALLGRSGSGKTTTLKLINRLLEPTGGDVVVEDRSTRDWDPVRLRRRIGYVIQDIGLFPHFTVARNVGLVPHLEGWSEARVRDRVDELLELAGLDPAEFRGRFPRELSGGQRQRVGVARALAADPPILLMDEPFGALDPLTRAEIQQEFVRLENRLKKTVVFVTHDIREALTVGTRITLLEAGRLAGVYSPQEFLSASDPLAAQYVETLRVGKVARDS